ncbi:hypothetical protein FHY13_003529 [Xanthomonas arboricola]|nr:hypothetical protein [Xanthomonas euroxanthea]
MQGLNHPRPKSTARSVAGAVPSPLAGRAVNPSLGARWRHPCRHTVPQPVRTPHQTVGRCSCESCLSCGAHQTWSRYVMSERRIQHRSYRAHRPSRQVLACSPSRDLTRHGCRVRAYRDVLAACPAMVGRQGPCTNAQRRGRGVLTACGTRREPIPGGSVAASMPPHGPATGEDTAPDSGSAAFLKAWRSACGGQTRRLQIARQNACLLLGLR